MQRSSQQKWLERTVGLWGAELIGGEWFRSTRLEQYPINEDVPSAGAPVRWLVTGGRGSDHCIDAVGMEGHGPGLLGAYDKVKTMMMLETDRAYALRQAIMACRSGGTVSVAGVYSGFIDKFPMGVIVNRSLTIKSGQTHVHKYMRPLLERIERRGQAQAGGVGHQRPEHSIAGEMRSDGLRVGIQIEHAPHPGDQRGAGGHGGRTDPQFQGVHFRQRTHRKPAGYRTDAQAAPIAVGIECFHARQQAQGEVTLELLPVPGRQEGEVEKAGGAVHVRSLAPF